MTLERCVSFLRDSDARLAERAVRTKHGVAYFCDSLPRVWYRNVVSIDPGTEASAAELALEAEAVQAKLDHRKVAVYDGLGRRIAGDFAGRGWTVEELLVMPHAREVALPDLSMTDEVEAEELLPVWREGIRSGIPDDETVRQLAAAQLDRRIPLQVRYFGARADGRIAAYCELFQGGGVGQIESVMCLEGFRGRGLGKAVVARALAESKAAGHELTFLVADAGDWPKELYRKLGFDAVGSVWDFVRPGP